MTPSEILSKWYTTGYGEYVFKCRYELLRLLTSQWGKRNSRLLQIGCGDGKMLYHLWEDGYIVAGIDSNQNLLEQAKLCLGGRGDISKADPECLPYNANEFEYTVFPISFEFLDNPEKALEEALRVSSRGVAFLFPNKYSIINFYADKIGYPSECRVFIPPFKAKKLASIVSSGTRITLKTNLFSPPQMWDDANYKYNIRATWIPFGVCAGIEILKSDGIPVHPLTLKTGFGFVKKDATSPAQ